MHEHQCAVTVHALALTQQLRACARPYTTAWCQSVTQFEILRCIWGARHTNPILNIRKYCPIAVSENQYHMPCVLFIKIFAPRSFSSSSCTPPIFFNTVSSSQVFSACSFFSCSLILVSFSQNPPVSSSVTFVPPLCTGNSPSALQLL